MKSNIVLIGFMGSGKSITGKLLAYRLGYSFVDTDTAIEQEYKTKIKDMFAKEGEAVFLLAKKSNEERLKTIIELMAKRAPFYKKADLIIKTDDTTPLQNVEIIMKYLKGVK